MPNQTHLLSDGYSADDVCVKQQMLYLTNGDKVHREVNSQQGYSFSSFLSGKNDL